MDLEFGVIATITGCSFTGNVATGGAGCIAEGGAFNTEGCTLTLKSSSFTGNQAIGGTFNGAFGDSGKERRLRWRDPGGYPRHDRERDELRAD